MYVDCLDLSTVDFTGVGGPPPTHKFVVSAWTISAVKAVLAADSENDSTYGKLDVIHGCLRIVSMFHPTRELFSFVLKLTFYLLHPCYFFCFF